MYTRWIRPDAWWVRWIKPVLFSHVHDWTLPQIDSLPAWITPALFEPLRSAAEQKAERHPYRQSETLRDVAIVVDLPGAAGVPAGLALAQEGFRPIPLYNAIPAAGDIIDQRPILAALVAGAEMLPPLPREAPPAFLLDADRARPTRAVAAPWFDNRWACFPEDFPSPDLLWEHGIRRAVLVQPGDRPVSPDLAKVLLAWQARGIRFFFAAAGFSGPVTDFVVTRPSLLVRLREWMRQQGYARTEQGAFGGRLVAHESELHFGGSGG